MQDDPNLELDVDRAHGAPRVRIFFSALRPSPRFAAPRHSASTFIAPAAPLRCSCCTREGRALRSPSLTTSSPPRASERTFACPARASSPAPFFLPNLSLASRHSASTLIAPAALLRCARCTPEGRAPRTPLSLKMGHFRAPVAGERERTS